MIQNNIELLAEPFKTKIKIFLDMVHKTYPNVKPFETLRTIDRQKQLVAEGKSWTLNSYHLVGKAVDFIFEVDGKPTWVGDYKYLHYVGEFVGIKPIKNTRGQIVEWCHLQDNLRSIKYMIKINKQRRRDSKSETEKDILHYVNEQFRKYIG